MRTIFKKGHKVNVIQTGYIPGTYIHHPGGEGKIIKLLDASEWKEPLVPLYEVSINKKNYIIPEYSMEKKWKI